MTTIQLSEKPDRIAGVDRNKRMNISFQGAGTSAKYLIDALDQIHERKPGSIEKFNEWKLEPLIDYIIFTHHKYARESAATIHDLMQTVLYRHGEDHPEIKSVATAMFLFLHDFVNHMMKEEQILFPNIRQLVRNINKINNAGRTEYTTFGLIREWVTKLQQEHQSANESLRLFHRLTNNYTLPKEACGAYKSLFEKLREFEADFLVHSYLENNILFPKALIADGEIE